MHLDLYIPLERDRGEPCTGAGTSNDGRQQLHHQWEPIRTKLDPSAVGTGISASRKGALLSRLPCFALLLPAFSMLAARQAVQDFTDILEGGETRLQQCECLGFRSQYGRRWSELQRVLYSIRKVENQLQRRRGNVPIIHKRVC